MRGFQHAFSFYYSVSFSDEVFMDSIKMVLQVVGFSVVNTLLTRIP
jgi:hypothetical protein